MLWLNCVVALAWADLYIRQMPQLDLQESWALPAEMYPTALCLRAGRGYSPLIHLATLEPRSGQNDNF